MDILLLSTLIQIENLYKLQVRNTIICFVFLSYYINILFATTYRTNKKYSISFKLLKEIQFYM